MRKRKGAGGALYYGNSTSSARLSASITGLGLNVGCQDWVKMHLKFGEQLRSKNEISALSVDVRIGCRAGIFYEAA